MADILVIGSLNADLVVRAPRFPQPGETISGSDLRIIPGGKGANQAVAAARQGTDVTMLGRVGNDSFGPFLIESLKSDRVDAANVLLSDSATGTAIIIVDANGQNSIVLSAGANGKVSPNDVDALRVDAKILLLQLEIPLETVLHAAAWGRRNSMTVILNPAPARELPDELIAGVDFMLPNETELGLLTGQPVNDVSSAEHAARILLNRGAKQVIVTLGSNGSLIANNALSKHIPSCKVDVVDTTAAGDAFIGGFASMLLRGFEPESAVKYANACGAVATTKFGAQPSLPTKAEVDSFLKETNRGVR